MRQVAVIGAGPAGLMAAEALSEANCATTVYDAMPSVGRKFLLAGKGGLNLTHAEEWTRFLGRYSARLDPWLERFPPEAIREWAAGLGVETFVGSSQRVFPADMKAAPLLRAWLRRLKERGVVFQQNRRWLGWSGTRLRFESELVQADAVVLALGGGSWPRLGSDGSWVPWLRERGVTVNPLQPSNCGFVVAWSAYFREHFAGHPLKSVELRGQRGELVVTEHGLEGSLLYAFSPQLREEIAQTGAAEIELDLSPDRSLDRLQAELSKPRGSKSQAQHLRQRVGLEGVRANLLREVLGDLGDPLKVAQTIKALPVRLTGTRPLAEAISSAGGVALEEFDERLMLRKLPGVFCAGEMLDWEAPTGGYLLSACLATGRVAGQGAVEWLASIDRTR